MQAGWTGKIIRIKGLSRSHFYPLPYLPLEQGRFLLYGNPLNPWMTSLSIPILLPQKPHYAENCFLLQRGKLMSEPTPKCLLHLHRFCEKELENQVVGDVISIFIQIFALPSVHGITEVFPGYRQLF